MDKVVIEVPEGQIAKVNKQVDGNVLVTFENAEYWKSITTLSDAIDYLYINNMCLDLLNEYKNAPSRSYSEAVAAYRIVVAALTNNEERYLTTGERWYPIIQFCKVGKEKYCHGNKVLGTIESEGEKFSVVSGYVADSGSKGLGYFHSDLGISVSWSDVSFRSVSRREIAEHISKYFGRLLFEVHYGGTNCDYKWIN